MEQQFCAKFIQNKTLHVREHIGQPFLVGIIRNMGGIPAKIWVLANTVQFFSLTPPEMSSTNIDT